MKNLEFNGNGTEYFKIWIVNMLLTIITLGLYYPWAKVRSRRYFYANTTLEDRNFEYHATGKQLFLGFLIAMSIFIIYMLIQQISPIGSLVLLGVLFLAIPWLIWRSLIFSMKMTSFSNVRFSFVGTLKQSYINFLVYPIILILGYAVFAALYTVLVPIAGELLGVTVSIVLFIVFLFYVIYALSLIKKKNTEYTINGSRYGQGVFHAKLKADIFMKITLKSILITLLVMGVAILFIGGMIYATVGLESLIDLKNSINDPVLMQEKMQELMPILGFSYFIMILALMISMTYSITRQRTYIMAHTMLDDDISFASTLRALPLTWVMISNLFLIFFTLGLAFPWAKVRMARLILENTEVATQTGLDAYLTQKQEEESSLGEQIGDAFDVDIDVGF